MKRKIQSAVLLLWIIFIAAGTSCNKDPQTSPPKTKTELITAGTWKRTALTSNPAYDWNVNGVSDTNILNIMFPCEKDNFDQYLPNHTGEYNEGTTKCNASDPQKWPFAWTFAENETKLIFDGFDVYTLVELTATTLIYKSTFTENGVTYTQVETYGH